MINQIKNNYVLQNGQIQKLKLLAVKSVCFQFILFLSWCKLLI